MQSIRSIAYPESIAYILYNILISLLETYNKHFNNFIEISIGLYQFTHALALWKSLNHGPTPFQLSENAGGYQLLLSRVVARSG